MPQFLRPLLTILGLLVFCVAPVIQAQASTFAEEDVDTLVEGNTNFALDLYQTLRSEEGNLFFAPHSISVALAMLYAGARDATEQQMAETLQFTLPQTQLHQAFAELDATLTPESQDDEPGFELRVANALWGQRGYGFLPQYLELLDKYYQAGLVEVDFEASPEEARETINRWVSEQTEGHIDDLLPTGSVDSMTRLILTNAVYFKAAWLYVFSESLTIAETFTLLSGEEVMVQMMRQTERFNYVRLEEAEALTLPYAGDKLVMLVFLPDEGAFTEFEASMTPALLERAVNNLSPTRVLLRMPKFTYSSSFSLRSALSRMGMPDAFTEDANFSGLAGNQELLVQDVLHEAFVLVDEEGTEAAAATGVAVGIASLEPDPIEVTIDRPFIYLIQDTETGSILFMGRVLNPLSE